MDDPYKSKENTPASEGPDSSTKALAVEDQSDENRPHNLCQPVYDVVQGTRSDVEDGTVVVSEFYGYEH